MENYICSICGKNDFGYGNNAWPINNGRCCDQCNMEKVIPERMFNLLAYKKAE